MRAHVCIKQEEENEQEEGAIALAVTLEGSSFRCVFEARKGVWLWMQETRVATHRFWSIGNHNSDCSYTIWVHSL